MENRVKLRVFAAVPFSTKLRTVTALEAAQADALLELESEAAAEEE